MAAVAYGAARVAAKSVAREETAKPRKNWFVRLFDAMIEARMQQVRREMAMHARLLPYAFDERGNRLVKAKSDDMPFGGW